MQLAVGSLNYITCKNNFDDFNFGHKSVRAQNFRRAKYCSKTGTVFFMVGTLVERRFKTRKILI